VHRSIAQFNCALPQSSDTNTPALPQQRVCGGGGNAHFSRSPVSRIALPKPMACVKFGTYFVHQHLSQLLARDLSH
jgi:hypothetical protein